MRVQPAQLQHPVARGSASTAARAAPPASEKPNFWSSWAVAMYSWVCASTPDGDPDQHPRPGAAVAGQRGQPVDLVERVDHDPARPRRPPPGSARRPTCCCRAAPIRSGGIPAASATASSPPVQTSRYSPSSAMIAHHRLAQERLRRRRRRRRRRSCRRSPGSGPGSRPRRTRRPGYRTRRPARARDTPPTPQHTVRHRAARYAGHSRGTRRVDVVRAAQPGRSRVPTHRRAARRPRVPACSIATSAPGRRRRAAPGRWRARCGRPRPARAGRGSAR